MGGPANKGGPGTDNFHEARFELDGEVWPTCEHYYQAQKFSGDDPEAVAQRRAIRDAALGVAYTLGQMATSSKKHLHLDTNEWERRKASVMYRCVKAKYEQHPDLLAELLATEGPITAAPSFANWQQLNGLILERVREELRPEGPRITEARMGLLRKFTDRREEVDFQALAEERRREGGKAAPAGVAAGGEAAAANNFGAEGAEGSAQDLAAVAPEVVQT